MSTPFSRRRMIVAVPLAAALSLSAAACGGSDSGGGSGNANTLKILSQTGSQQQALTDLAKKFEEENPGKTIQTEFVDPGTYSQILLTRLRSGSGADIFYANGGTGQSYSLKPLEEAGSITAVTGDWTSDIPEAAQPLYTFDDKVYGLPLALVPVGMAYNKDAFDQLGLDVPTSLDELMADCATAAKSGKYVMSLAGAAAPNAGVYAQMIAASSVYAADPDWNDKRASGDVTFADSAEWKQALQTIVDMKDQKCLQPGAEGTSIDTMFSQVATGKALSLPGPSGVIAAVKGITSSLNMDTVPFPGATADDTRAMVGYSDALAVSAKTKAKDLAEDFLTFMAEPDNARTYAEAGGTVSLADAASGNMPPEAQGFTDYVKNDQTASIPNLNWVNGDVYSALTTGVQGLLTGQQSPDDVLKAMDTAWDKGAS